MPVTLDDKLVVAISSRALFNLEEENRLFEHGDPDAYMRLQLERLDVPASPGIAYSLVRKLLRFNDDGVQRVEVVILSRNDPASGMRIFNSGAAAELQIQRGVFTQGRSPFRYLTPLNADLFLSANADDVREALRAGFAAAHVNVEAALASSLHPDEVRIAFDGDAVLFSDEAERVYQAQGLAAFQAHEADKAAVPLGAGPLAPFLVALHRLQQAAASTGMRIRTALVTARGAPAHRRAIQTLMSWNIRVDEAMFLAGLDKGGFLREFEPDFFFDDQTGHVRSAARHVPAGHVASGISNPG
ncbi:MAG: 5'-nucleotidase [Proteobacteria bacterium]|uniref:5'-nucleotidase n=1 Tax=Variovorax paradoxus TaxID=34073 RepID=A0A2W5SAJ7_VARPD|nr:5'-nucleotidase [Pseudomonadota bacterium]MDI3383319.1 5'-nucleotidase [Xenophilus aerolatus]PZQ76683.1 MAG: 5'-nucleotidase [Variovorax paradoxus]